MHTTQTALVTHVTQQFIDTATDMLAAYRKFCAANSSAGQLILPESLKLIPLYLSAATKFAAFIVNPVLANRASGNRSLLSDALVRADARAASLAALMSIPTHRMLPTLYPRVFRIDEIADTVGVLPAATPLSLQQTGAADDFPVPIEALLSVPLPPPIFPSSVKIDSACIYLIDSYSTIILLVGKDAPADAQAELFGVRASVSELPPFLLRSLGPHSSRRLRNIVESLRARRNPMGSATALRIVGPDDAPGRAAAMGLLVEDQTERGGAGNKSYVDLLCAVHSAIQQRQ